MRVKGSREERISIVRKMYENGKSVDEIAVAVGYKTVTVNQILSSERIRQSRKVEDYRNEIVSMRNEGKSLKEISEKTKFAPITIRRYLHDIGMSAYAVDKLVNVGEKDLIDENTVYAKQRKEKIEKVFACGKSYKTVPLSVFFTD